AALDLHEGDDNAASDFLGFEDQPFKFDHLPNEVTFEKYSVVSEDGDRVLGWVEDLMA
ncbi:hypothetical protein IWQ60_007019, partial [Tieghemiomyces parasiticus]